LRKAGVEASIDACCRALENHHYNVKHAIDELTAAPSSPVRDDVRSLIRSFSHQPATTGTTTTPDDSDSDSPPAPKRRRLVQGRRHQAPPSSQASPTKQPSPLRVIDLSSDDELAGNPGPSSQIIELSSDGEDAYSQRESSLENDVDSVETRVLNYLNECDLSQLINLYGSKNKAKAEYLLSHRPFRSVAGIKRIKEEKKKSRGKAIDVGCDIFDMVYAHIETLDAIDTIVAKCDREGAQIKAITSTWEVDLTGTKINPSVSGDGQLTPSSSEGRSLKPLPIRREPEYLRGNCKMKNYQLYGLNWLNQLYQHRFGCILADDMGLGKTCQVIAFLSHLIESYDPSSRQERPWPNLVVVPASTLTNWQNEFEKFAPDLQVTVYSGSKDERGELATEIFDNSEPHHVILTSYTQLGEDDVSAMKGIRPHVAVFDEAQKLKNSNTKIYKGFMRMCTETQWRLLLTGTPIQNNLMEMINLLRFIQPAIFSQHVEALENLFKQSFSLQDVTNGALRISDRVRRARGILRHFILQRVKEQVLSAMPPKTSRLVYCEMDDIQRPLYNSYERQFRRDKSAGEPAASQSRAAATRVVNDQNNVWVQLRKAAIHPQLFRREFDDHKVKQMAKILMDTVDQSELRQDNLAHLVGELKDCSDFELHLWCKDYPSIRTFDIKKGSWMQSGKIQALLKLIQEFKENGDRVLVFTRFAKVLNILRECLETAGVSFVTLEGSTAVSDRQHIIDDFNQNPDITVFCLTTGAGGTGINLTAANKVVIFDQSDNPQDDVQAENRAHRLGQTRDVEVIKLVTKGTIEELVHKACHEKLQLAKRVTGTDDAEEDDEDGARTAKQVENAVREMLLASGDQTPPESEHDQE